MLVILYFTLWARKAFPRNRCGDISERSGKGATPSADIMAKIANALGVSSDFLMNGSSNELADSSLTDKELLNQFKAIETMQEDDKTVIKTLIDAFITKKKVQQLAK